MRTLPLAAAVAALAIAAVSSPATAQSAQERLDARYDRALVAGYKALMLCSAIGNAEANGATRTPESVHEWELTGIYPKLDPIIRDLPYEIVRRPSGQIAHVQVEWDEAMPDRVAAFYGPDYGCSILPTGAAENSSEPEREISIGSVSSPRLMPPQNLFAEGMLGEAGEVLSDKAFDGTYGEGTRTTAVLVRQNGDRMFEYYTSHIGPNVPQRTWSVAKSIAATLVGAAVQRGELDMSASAGLGLDENDPRRAITIDHALRMASGRYSDTPGNRTDPLYWGGITVDERAQNWPLVNQPNTLYRYANNDTLAAVQAMEETFKSHPPTELFAKLGMRHTVAETDWQGNYVLSSQVWSTAPDLAKLGQLYLNDGMWNGERILPENWREYVSDPSGPQPEGTDWGYGAGWWTFKRPEGNSFEGIPDDAFAARGNRGQYVVVVPSRNVVIVRRGEDMVGTRFDIAAFTRDVLAALD
ncbi:MAG: serine hydrolase [Pseudomonadota bacterium]